MAPQSRLGKQIAEVTGALQHVGALYALIGGLALTSYRVIRATQDVDLLTEIEKADAIEAELIKLGYRRLHRSTDAANYSRADERVDLLYAPGSHAAAAPGAFRALRGRGAWLGGADRCGCSFIWTPPDVQDSFGVIADR